MAKSVARPAQNGLLRIPLAVALLLALAGCTALRHGFLNPAGPVAGGERHLAFIVALILAFVGGPVLILVPIFAWHYRLSNTKSAFRPNWDFSWPLEALIWLPPTAIVAVLAYFLWGAAHRFDPYRPLGGDVPPLRVQAVALDWKWLFIYPDLHIATVNDLEIPAGQPIHVQLTSGTVMQSLLMPQLAGQIYAMGGMTTQLNFAADRPGLSWGENTQYNGDGFPAERFRVTALSAADFSHWAGQVQRSGAPLDDAAYRALSRQSVPAAPIFFSAVPPGLFEHIVTITGGRSQPQPEPAHG